MLAKVEISADCSELCDVPQSQHKTPALENLTRNIIDHKHWEPIRLHSYPVVQFHGFTLTTDNTQLHLS